MIAAIGLARGRQDLAGDQFAIDDVVNDAPVFGVGDENLEPVHLLQPSLDRKSCSMVNAVPMRPTRVKPRPADRFSGGIGDMEQRDRDGAGDLVGHPMHRIRAEHQEIGAAALQPARRVLHRLRQTIPFAAMLKLLDFAEIDRPHQAARRMNAAEPVAHRLIDDPVIFGRALPAHAADEADHRLFRHDKSPVRSLVHNA